MELTSQRAPSSYCGTTSEYCAAPGCQIDFGTGCDGNQRPQGVDTSQVARPKLGGVPYGGVGIYDCVTTGEVAITFDDGPYEFTNDLLTKFQVRWFSFSRCCVLLPRVL